MPGPLAVLRLTFVILAAATLHGQTTIGPRIAFDVTSVKPNKNGDQLLRLDIQPGGRFVAVNIPLKQFIRAAYTLQLYQIVDAPSWVDSENFDITGLSDRDLTVTAPWTPGGQFAPAQLMMQSLLAERFQMRAHTETRQAQGYALVTASQRQGLTKLRAAALPCAPNCGMQTGAGTLSARNVPLPQLAELLSQVTGRVVIDATGAQGNFDMDLRWSAEADPGASDAPSIFGAVQEQLGLRLESRRVPTTILVIDFIDRPTSD